MKQLFTMLLLWTAASFCLADDYPHLVIQAKDGTKVSYLLRNLPQITFTDDEISVVSGGVSVAYEISHTSKFRYEMIEVPETGIIELQSDALMYQFEGDAVLFPELESGSHIRVFTVNGMLLFSKHIIEKGEYMLSLDHFPTGVYLIKVNETTCKIIKK